MLTGVSLRQRPWGRPPTRPNGIRLLVAEAVDRLLEPRALLGVAHAEARLRRQGQHADLALMGVLVDVEGRLTHLLEGVRLAEGRVDQAAVDQLVGLPGLAVVREVRADDALEVHPEVAVVVLVQVARRRGARDDGAALAGHVDARAEGLPAGVLEDDVDVVAAGELADPLAEALPLPGVLGRALVVPEPVVL